VARLFAGPRGVHICNECLKICEDILDDYEQRPGETGNPSEDGNEILRCSFCLKIQNEVKHLIAGPTVYICGDCAVRFHEETR
jgi:ATP-dependent protease Clp ATPase subunit